MQKNSERGPRRKRRAATAPITWVKRAASHADEAPERDVESIEFTPRIARKRRVANELFASDAVMLLVAVFGATLMEAFSRGELASLDLAVGLENTWVSLATVAFLLVALVRGRLYDLDQLGWGSGEFTRLPRSLALGVVALILVTFSMELSVLSRRWVALVWLLATVCVAGGRVIWRIWTQRYRTNSGWLDRPTLIVGSNVEAAEIARIMAADHASHRIPVGCVSSSLSDQLSLDFHSPEVPRLGEARDLVEIVRERDIDTVLIVASAFDADVLQRMIRELRDTPVHVQLTSGLTEVLQSRVFVRAVSGVPVISLRGVSFSPAHLGVKRVFDLAVGGTVIALGLPAWLTVAALIKLTSRGPVLYAQERVGKNGKPFKMYKFRSMVVDADARLARLQTANEADGPIFKMENDPRITGVGRWMRKYSVDEIPQLLNVMKGDLSLVGPRPPLPRETDRYSEHDWRRLEVSPGMTGLWQVSGRSDLSFQEMVRLDVFYIENWSVRLDAALLMRTVPAVLFARGAY